MNRLFAAIIMFWLCLSGNSFAAYFPLEITNIKPSGTGSPAIPSTNRIFRAYPGITYNIRPAVIGGLYPFTFSLSGQPSGMTINSSTGEITWVNPQTNSGTITLSVTDADNTTVTTTWAITVSTSGFVFVNGSYSGTETGSITQPYSSLANLLAGDHTYTDIVYFRTGTYPLFSYNPIGTGDMYLQDRPQYWIAYPGETVTLTGESGAHIRSDKAVYFDGLKFDTFTSYAMMLYGGHHYQTIRNCTFTNLTPLNGTNNNYGFIYTTEAQSSPGYYSVVQGNEFSNYAGSSAVGSLYDDYKMLIEDNYIHDDLYSALITIRNGISAKYRTNQITVRHNRVIMTDGYAFGRGSMNGPLEGADGIDCSFNLFVNQAGSFVDDFNGSSYTQDGSTKNFYFYRNTVSGLILFEFLDGTSANTCTQYSMGPFTIDHNVIINSNTAGSGWFMHNYIGYGSSNSDPSTSPWNCLTDTNNLKGLPATGIIDSNGLLTSGYLSYKGNTGWEILDSSTTCGRTSPLPGRCQ
jgi:hypothetical protein